MSGDTGFPLGLNGKFESCFDDFDFKLFDSGKDNSLNETSLKVRDKRTCTDLLMLFFFYYSKYEWKFISLLISKIVKVVNDKERVNNKFYSEVTAKMENNYRKRVFTIHENVISEEIYALLDGVYSADEFNIHNLMNDFDTEYIAEKKILQEKDMQDTSIVSPEANTHVV